MPDVKAKPGIILKGMALVRDAQGRPVIAKANLRKFWSALSPEDKVYIKQQHPETAKWR